MKSLTLSLAALVFSAGAAMADPLEGLWRTTQDDNGNFGDIQVAPCGANLCGTLVQSYDSGGAPFTSDNQGRQIIFDTVNNGGGNYSGQVYSPDRDRTYNSRLTLSGSTLSVEGCVLGICRNGGTWQRVN